MSVSLEWCGNLSGMLVPGYRQLYYVHWAPDAERPPGLPAIALPLDAGLRYFAGTPHDGDAWALLVQPPGDPSPWPYRYELLQVDADRARALLVDRDWRQSICPGDEPTTYVVSLLWLDLATGALTRFARLANRWVDNAWRCHLLADGSIWATGRQYACFVSPAGEVRQWELRWDLGPAAVGRHALAFCHGQHLVLGPPDGGAPLHQVPIPPAAFSNLAFDDQDRLWAFGPAGLRIYDADLRPIFDAGSVAIGEPLGWPDWQGVDALGRIWFHDWTFFRCFRPLVPTSPPRPTVPAHQHPLVRGFDRPRGRALLCAHEIDPDDCFPAPAQLSWLDLATGAVSPLITLWPEWRENHRWSFEIEPDGAVVAISEEAGWRIRSDGTKLPL